MVNNTETCFCDKDYNGGDFCELSSSDGITQLTVCHKKKCRLNLKRLFILMNYIKKNTWIGGYKDGSKCLVYNNEETCFCSDGFYGNNCEYNYSEQDTNITISNCEKTSCFNGNLILIHFLFLFWIKFYI